MKVSKSIYLLAGYLILSILFSCNEKQEESIQQNAVEEAGVGDQLIGKDTKSQTIHEKSKFDSLIREVGQIDYVLKEYEELSSSQNFISKRIDQLNRNRKNFEIQGLEHAQIDTSNIVMVRRAFIKGTVDLGNRLFTRAEIESWKIKDELAAQQVFEEVEPLATNYQGLWDGHTKSPITCFRKSNEILFIIPGGFYMLDEVPILKKYFKENL